jgi:malonyl CoA-acyl carrier protein transacylase
MALEEAQNAKSVVRLTRDNDGNYAYQYTADDDKVASAYQEYEDVLQQINDLASGRVGELEQAMLDAQTQYADAAKEIALDMTLTEEQRQAKLEELAKRYEETLLYIQEEYGYATGDLKNNLATVSSWYNTALVEDSDKAKEQVADMIKNAQTWAQEYANLLTGEDGSVLSAWNNYAKAIAGMTDLMDTVMTEEGLKNYEQAAAAAGNAALQVVG